MAIDLDPSSFPGYRALGVSLAGLNRYDEAIEALTTCALLSSRHVWALGELCWFTPYLAGYPKSRKY
jgi:hypothetical protein